MPAEILVEFCLQKPVSSSVGSNCESQQEGNFFAQMSEKDKRAEWIDSKLKKDYFRRKSMKGGFWWSKTIQNVSVPSCKCQNAFASFTFLSFQIQCVWIWKVNPWKIEFWKSALWEGYKVHWYLHAFLEASVLKGSFNPKVLTIRCQLGNKYG